jgi:hypothetical protein
VDAASSSSRVAHPRNGDRHSSEIPDAGLFKGVTRVDVWRIMSTAIRRWYIFLPLVLLSGYLASTVNISSPEYTATGVEIAVPTTAAAATDAADPTSGNPYGNSDVATGAIIATVGSDGTRTQLAANGLSSDYKLVSDGTTLVTITVNASSADQAVATGRELFTRSRDALAGLQRQAQVAPQRMLTVQVVTDFNSVTHKVSSKIQSLIALGAVGIVVAFILTVVIDDLLILARRRKSAEFGDQPADSLDHVDEVAHDLPVSPLPTVSAADLPLSRNASNERDDNAQPVVRKDMAVSSPPAPTPVDQGPEDIPVPVLSAVASVAHTKSVDAKRPDPVSETMPMSAMSRRGDSPESAEAKPEEAADSPGPDQLASNNGRSVLHIGHNGGSAITADAKRNRPAPRPRLR